LSASRRGQGVAAGDVDGVDAGVTALATALLASWPWRPPATSRSGGHARARALGPRPALSLPDGGGLIERRAEDLDELDAPAR
jgi:hypothetical protein